jgi:hypothetical protein
MKALLELTLLKRDIGALLNPVMIFKFLKSLSILKKYQNPHIHRHGPQFQNAINGLLNQYSFL